jgi:hypothetical protein
MNADLSNEKRRKPTNHDRDPSQTRSASRSSGSSDRPKRKGLAHQRSRVEHRMPQAEDADRERDAEDV